LKEKDGPSKLAPTKQLEDRALLSPPSQNSAETESRFKLTGDDRTHPVVLEGGDGVGHSVDDEFRRHSRGIGGALDHWQKQERKA